MVKNTGAPRGTTGLCGLRPPYARAARTTGGRQQGATWWTAGSVPTNIGFIGFSSRHDQMSESVAILRPLAVARGTGG